MGGARYWVNACLKLGGLKWVGLGMLKMLRLGVLKVGEAI